MAFFAKPDPIVNISQIFSRDIAPIDLLARQTGFSAMLASIGIAEFSVNPLMQTSVFNTITKPVKSVFFQSYWIDRFIPFSCPNAFHPFIPSNLTFFKGGGRNNMLRFFDQTYLSFCGFRMGFTFSRRPTGKIFETYCF